VVEETDRVAFVRLDVEEVQDHDRPTFALEEGVRWHWTDEDAEQADAEIRTALRSL
jgi:hypothetical protein